jgi:hypothetical protein
MREQPLPPDCFYGYVSNHYARLRRRTIVTKPDNRPDLSAIRTALLSNGNGARLRRTSLRTRKIGTTAGNEAHAIISLDAARALCVARCSPDDYWFDGAALG